MAELLERVRAGTLAAQQNQDIPFEQVVERIDPAEGVPTTTSSCPDSRPSTTAHAASTVMNGVAPCRRER